MGYALWSNRLIYGYMDPEYFITQELTEKSDIYSYGVLLLELVAGRKAIQDGKNIIEWSQKFLSSDARLHELVDPAIVDAFDLEQLQAVLEIIRWCTHREGRVRPSIKQVLRMLVECLYPVQDEHSGGALEHDGGAERRASKARMNRNELMAQSGDGRCLMSSSSTTKSYCSRSILLETGSPQSPPVSISFHQLFSKCCVNRSHNVVQRLFFSVITILVYAIWKETK